MSPERWQQVKEIFGAALEREPAGRADFVAEVCAGDEELRREVESLLDADGQETGLLGGPLSGLAAELLDGRAGPRPGSRLGHYELEREIGRGGMGVVYLARDTRLGRPVALKLLSYSFTSDPERVARFKREAHAVARLNHPNILTAYEVGEANCTRSRAGRLRPRRAAEVARPGGPRCWRSRPRPPRSSSTSPRGRAPRRRLRRRWRG